MPKSNVSFSSPSNRNSNIPLRPGADLSGLFLSGQVIDRTRRTIQTRMDTTTQIVTYTIMDSSSRRYYVDEYAPNEYHEIGDNIIIPVYVKTFKKNNREAPAPHQIQAKLVPYGAGYRLFICSSTAIRSRSRGTFLISTTTLCSISYAYPSFGPQSFSTIQRPSGRLNQLILYELIFLCGSTTFLLKLRYRNVIICMRK